ncbi:MAG TPA: flagellin, partial [Caulobacteraceae bacterium]|nr:flagellin [Caulobacteraceae bacterium]
LSFSSPVDGRPGLINMAYSFENVDPNIPQEPTLTTTGLNPNVSLEYGASNVPGQIDNWSTQFQYGNWTDFSATNPSSVSFDFNTTQFPPPAPPAAFGVTVQNLSLTPFRTQESILSSPDGESIPLYYRPMTNAWLNLSNFTSLSPAKMLSTVDSAINQVNVSAAAIGTQQNTITIAQSQANRTEDALTEGLGNLVDANMAQESAKLLADQTKQQLAVKSLSIANSQPQILLSLFK